MRVRVPGGGLERRRGSGLDDLACIHDRDPVGDLDQQREVVRDEENGEATLALQILDLLQDLALHHDVERSRRLVHDHQLGLERERHRDDHALPHPAGELVGIRADPARVDPDELEQLAGTEDRVTPRDPLVRLHHVDELRTDAHHGVEAVHRTLEDHRDVAPAELPELLGALAGQFLTAKVDRSPDDSGRRAEDLHDRVRDGALAAARLAGEADDLAGADLEVDSVDGAHRVCLAVLHLQAAHLDEHLGLAIVVGRRGRRACQHGHAAFPPASARPPVKALTR